MSGIIGVGSKSGIIGSTEIPGGYEEGEWTPVLTSSGGGTWTLHAQSNGWYTKIGQTVTYGGMISITGVSSESGHLKISLPFSPGDSDGDGDYTFGTLYLSGHGGNFGDDKIYTFLYSASTLFPHKTSSSGVSAYIDTGDVDGIFSIGFGGVYHTDA